MGFFKGILTKIPGFNTCKKEENLEITTISLPNVVVEEAKTQTQRRKSDTDTGILSNKSSNVTSLS